MKKHPLAILCLKASALSLPFLLLVAYYIQRDPFMVIRHYADYDHSHICQNEGYVSWQKYKRYRDTERYDAFIMGNSCTMAFACADWNRHIHGRPFRLFCNNLGLADLLEQLQALDRQPRQPLRHLLVVLDRQSFVNYHPSTGAMHIMPPEVSHKRWLKVQTVFLQAFLDPKVLLPYLQYELTGQLRSSMRGIVNAHVPVRTTYTNDAILAQEDSIRKQGEAYWSGDSWKHARETRPSTSPRLLFAPHVRLLREIRTICRRNNTDLRLVIGPNTDRIAMNPHDVATLRAVLGHGRVYDYSNEDRLNDCHNFYDACHYRRPVGRQIMDAIYRQSAGPSPSQHQGADLTKK